MDRDRKIIIGLLVAILALLLVFAAVWLIRGTRDGWFGRHMRSGVCPEGASGWQCQGGRGHVMGMESSSQSMPGHSMMRMPGMMGGMPGAMGGGASAAMEVADGRLYVLAGDRLFSMDAETYGDVRSAQVPGEGQAHQTMLADALMQVHDRDGDGVITGEEASRDSRIWRFDVRGEGRLTRDDLLQRPADRAARGGMMSGGMGGAASMLVSDGAVHVWRSGVMHRFDARSLDLLETRPIEPPQDEDASD